jgi:hypothetical protein
MVICCDNFILLFIDVIITSTRGLQPGVGVPPRVREDFLGVRENILRGM